MEDKWLEKLKQGICIPEKHVKLLCEMVKDILIDESNIRHVSSPVVVCGDIHGQFYDLIKLFKTGGQIENTKYVFLGDFVDRGYNSVETIELLLVYKLKYPNNITLIRGNHESRKISLTYGFYEEINKKYGNTSLWRHFNDLFDYFVLGAIIDNNILCLHGGMSPQISTIDQIKLINRRMELPEVGPLADIMWSDPDNIETWVLSNRGSGWMFGWKVVEEVRFFLDFPFPICSFVIKMI